MVPTAIDAWIVGLATGGSVSGITPIAWFVAIMALILIARQRMAAMDF